MELDVNAEPNRLLATGLKACPRVFNMG